MKVEITKCYCVQVLDEEGNEISCEYYFGDKPEAKEIGRKLKAQAMEERRKEKGHDKQH